MTEGRPIVRGQKLLAFIDRGILAVAVLAVFTLLVDLGWVPTLVGWPRLVVLSVNALVVALFLFENFARLLLAPSMARHVRENVFDATLTALFLVVLFSEKYVYQSTSVGEWLRSRDSTLTGVYLFTGQIYILLTLVAKAVVYQRRLSASRFPPSLVVVGSFALVVALGAVLLASPHALSDTARASEGRIPVIDSIFTAASAVCVTGLTVKDIGVYFSTFGQVVIMLLIQVGGLGLMTFVAFSSLVLGKGLAISERVVMQDVLSYEVMSKLPRMVAYIFLLTFGTEALGALILYFSWHSGLSVGQRAYMSVFHAVSAYCNAGFSLFATNFVEYRNSIPVVGAITGLIIFGGLGFTVQSDLAERAWRGLTNRAYRLWYALRKPSTLLRWRLKGRPGAEAPLHLGTHSKVVLYTTAMLLFWGAVLFAFFEWAGVLSGMGLRERVLASWFQSVTPRTAGFNAVDIGLVRLTTLVLLMVLMFIGASPGGTGGGIKTSTFAVICATVRATLQNRLNVEMFRRTIPLQTIRQSLAVVFLAIVLLMAGVLLLAVTQPGIAFDRLLFEEMSAFGTVGLSTGTAGTHLGATPLSLSAALSPVGKLVIILTMLAGRIGSLTMLIAVAQKSATVNFEYPSTRITVG